MAKRKKARKSILLRLLVLGVSVYMVATLINLWNYFDNRRDELSKLESQRAAEEFKVEELKTLLSEGSKSQITEKAARERLGYVYSDEEIYIDISGS